MLNDAVRAVLDAFHTSACSYVKPGAMHRLSLSPMLDHYILAGHAMLPVIEKAYRRGEEVARGERGMPEAGLGSLILDAARMIYAWTGRPAPSLDAATGVLIIAAAAGHTYSSGKHVSLGEVRASAMRLVQASLPKDFADFYEALRVSGEHRAIDILEDKGLRPSRAGVEGLTLLDAFEALGEKHPAYSALSPRTGLFTHTADLIRSRYEEKRSLNDAVVYAYASLIRDGLPADLRGMLEEAGGKGYMSTRDGGRILLKLDREMLKRGISLDKYVPILTMVLAALMLEGLRP